MARVRRRVKANPRDLRAPSGTIGPPSNDRERTRDAIGSERARRWLALLTIDVVWGTTYLAMAVAIEAIPPFAMAAIRYLLAGAIVAVFVGRRRLAAVASAPGVLRDAVIVGTSMASVANGFVAWGQQEVPSGWAALIVAMAPAWTAAIAWLCFRERLRPVSAGGIVLGLLGVAWLVFPESADGRLDLVRVGAVVVAPISWAVGSLYVQRRAVPEVTSRAGMALQLMAGGAVLGAFSALSGEASAWITAWTTGPDTGGLIDLTGSRMRVASLVALGYLVIFGTVVAWSAYGWLLRHAPIGQVMTYAFVNPLVAVVLGAVARSEPVSGSVVGAALTIAVAVVLVVTTASPAREPRNNQSGRRGSADDVG